MLPLEGERLLAAWEDGASEHDQRRPLTMLSLALPEREQGELAELPLAEVNLLLLELHELSFGARLEVFGSCYECDAPFESSVPVAELLAFQADRLGDGPVTWREHGRAYRLRPATISDLLASLEHRDETAAQEQLLARCLGAEPSNGVSRSSTVIERFEEQNAGAELSLALTCPGCGELQLLDLDLGRFVWSEVRHEASRLLGEIHVLASAYGWNEQAIVGMSARRRDAYLELLEI